MSAVVQQIVGRLGCPPAPEILTGEIVREGQFRVFMVELRIEHIVAVPCRERMRQVCPHRVAARFPLRPYIDDVGYPFSIAYARIVDEIDTFHKFRVQ